MRRLKWILPLVVAVALALLLLLRQNEPPNILFILTDDQRWDSLGCYGNSAVRTPNLDRVAAEGARLDAFYVATPLCCPSRIGFLTGLYPYQTGMYLNDGARIPKEQKTIAHYLHDAGFLTGYIGKTHVTGSPLKWGFDEAPVYLRSCCSEHENPFLVVDGKGRRVPGLITEIFADAAIQFLRKHQSERWFLMLATTAPHEPFYDHPKHRYQPSEIVPSPGWPKQQELNRELWPQYYSTVSMLDEELGLVFAELKNLGLEDDTFVFFTSDNGFMAGSHGYQYKAVWFEESIRVPALARWPGHIRAGSIIRTPLLSIDFLPTIQEIVNQPRQHELKGASMIPALLGQTVASRKIFIEGEGDRALMNGKWKLLFEGPWKFVHFAGQQKDDYHLYNLQSDPEEQKDLVGDPMQSARVARMKASLK